MIGELIAELKTVQLYEHTTVVFWTDHGYLLRTLNATYRMVDSLELQTYMDQVQARRALRLVQA